MLDLDDVRPVDNHCHSLLNDQGPYALERWRHLWSESPYAQIARDHVQNTVYYRWSMNQLADEFQCEPTEDAVLAFHNEHCGTDLAAQLLQKAHFDALMLDDGWPPRADSLPAPRLSDLAACRIGLVHRLELRQEELLQACGGFDEFEERYRDEMSSLRERGISAAKSIVAYRGGLRIGEADSQAARQAFTELKALARQRGAVRIDDKRLLDFTLRIALEEAAKQEIPLQLHTGYGDPDEDLRLSNPLYLRNVLEDRRYWGAPVVLLHESWPYVREAAYLSAVYPHVFMDLSFAVPYLDYGEMVRFTCAALGTAPASKLLFGTDSYALPEHFFLGARRGRVVLGTVLEQMVSDRVLSGNQAEDLAEMVMRGTAWRLYHLG
jgi:hypothetical protein